MDDTSYIYNDISDYYNKRLLCTSYYLQSGMARAYPICVINDDGTLTEIPEDMRRYVFSREGAIFVPVINHSKWTMGKHVLELKIGPSGLTRNMSPGPGKDDWIAKPEVNAEISPYKFDKSYACIAVGISSEQLSEESVIPFDGREDIQGQLSQHIYLKCNDHKIVGPFKYTCSNEILRVSGTEKLNYQVNSYDEKFIRATPILKEGDVFFWIIPEVSLNKATPTGTYECLSEETLKDELLRCLKIRPDVVTGVKAVRAVLPELLGDSPMLRSKPERMKHFELFLNKIENYERISDAIISYVCSKPEKLMSVFKARPDIRKQFISKDPELLEMSENYDRMSRANKQLTEELTQIRGRNRTLEREQQQNQMRHKHPQATPHEIQELREQIAQDEAALKVLQGQIDEYGITQEKLSALHGEKVQLEQEISRLGSERNGIQEEISAKSKQLEEASKQIAKIQTDREKTASEIITKIHNHVHSLKEAVEACNDTSSYIAESVNRKMARSVQKVIDAAFIQEPDDAQNVQTKESSCETSGVVQSLTFPKGTEPPLALDADLKPEMGDDELADKILERVERYLQMAGRNVSRDEVVNYLTCIAQGFITIFAGAPGSGKTSLCNLLAHALGLVADGKSTHFVESAVSRGWTSAKDFIGYYNPLSHEMVKSDASVYDALVLTQHEDSREVPPMMILLDEANLSPVEHYWSDFLRNSDFDSSAKRCFSLGGNLVWEIKDHLRFLATVNHDHTTEDLSPRFLSRSWVVMIEEELDSEEIPQSEHPLVDGAAVPYWAFERAFAAQSDESLDETSSSKWQDIKKILGRHNMPIMPRSARMVANYVRVASKHTTEPFKAIDYALAQKILPSISGSGQELRDCLLDLKECCKGAMQESHKQIERMLATGEKNMGIYQFFAR